MNDRKAGSLSVLAVQFVDDLSHHGGCRKSTWCS